MNASQDNLKALHDIRQMMEKSSRFISLSGLSGIAAGVCALAGAALAYPVMMTGGVDLLEMRGTVPRRYYALEQQNLLFYLLQNPLVWIGLGTFVAAFTLALLFTWLRSRKAGIPLWGSMARRLVINGSIPLAVGGIVVIKFLELGLVGLIAPSCLLFYGLALVNASKYTLGEIRYMGYCQLILGIVNLWWLGYGLYFWALGFGVCHIAYGAAMWWKYERKVAAVRS